MRSKHRQAAAFRFAGRSIKPIHEVSLPKVVVGQELEPYFHQAPRRPDMLIDHACSSNTLAIAGPKMDLLPFLEFRATYKQAPISTDQYCVRGFSIHRALIVGHYRQVRTMRHARTATAMTDVSSGKFF